MKLKRVFFATLLVVVAFTTISCDLIMDAFADTNSTSGSGSSVGTEVINYIIFRDENYDQFTRDEWNTIWDSIDDSIETFLNVGFGYDEWYRTEPTTGFNEESYIKPRDDGRISEYLLEEIFREIESKTYIYDRKIKYFTVDRNIMNANVDVIAKPLVLKIGQYDTDFTFSTLILEADGSMSYEHMNSGMITTETGTWSQTESLPTVSFILDRPLNGKVNFIGTKKTDSSFVINFNGYDEFFTLNTY